MLFWYTNIQVKITYQHKQDDDKVKKLPMLFTQLSFLYASWMHTSFVSLNEYKIGHSGIVNLKLE